MKTIHPIAGEDETLDSFYHGRILVLQKKKGYRFSVDAPLLADFIQTRATDVLLEAGGGCGIISLLLSVKPFRRIVCLEVQKALARLAVRNVRLNGLERKIRIVEQDLRVFQPKTRFDVVFSNPPYIKKKTGMPSSSVEKAVAKHEIKCDIFDIIGLTGRSLKKSGRAYFIYPARRMEGFSLALDMHHLKTKTLRWVHPKSGSPARWFLAECDFVSSSTKTLAPLVLCDERGQTTRETKRIYAGESRGQVGP